jgi:hypothetical protein
MYLSLGGWLGICFLMIMFILLEYVDVWLTKLGARKV